MTESGTFSELCEMCRERESRWHQRHPVERWLCLDCAQSDRNSCTVAWVGALFPIIDSDGERTQEWKSGLKDGQFTQR